MGYFAVVVRRAKWLFFDWPEKLVVKTTARQRRIINFWLLIVWIFPGFPIWFLLHNALWFVGFMSIYAIWASHFAGWSAETPVEEE